MLSLTVHVGLVFGFIKAVAPVPAPIALTTPIQVTLVADFSSILGDSAFHSDDFELSQRPTVNSDRPDLDTSEV